MVYTVSATTCCLKMQEKPMVKFAAGAMIRAFVVTRFLMSTWPATLNWMSSPRVAPIGPMIVRDPNATSPPMLTTLGAANKRRALDFVVNDTRL